MDDHLTPGDPQALPTVAVVALGGTISRAASDTGGPDVGRQPVEALVTAVPSDLARLDLVELARKSSSALTLDDLRSLAGTLTAVLAEGADGAVVMQGTDTLEETAYALALMVPPHRPITLTGSMRLGHEPGADGDANVIDAVRVATEPRAALLGPVVVISGELHLARWVRKARTSGVHAFESAGFGPVGTVVENNVHLWAAPLTEEFLGLPERLEATVEVIAPEVGSDARRLEPLLDAVDGVVVAAMGGGHVPPSYVPLLAAAAQRGTPVVLASRTAAGPVLESTYGGTGCERELIAAGLIPAGMLSPSKSRLRLAVALSLGLQAGEVFPHDGRVARRGTET